MVRKYQAGFRTDNSTVDQKHANRQIMEKFYECKQGLCLYLYLSIINSHTTLYHIRTSITNSQPKLVRMIKTYIYTTVKIYNQI